MDPHSEEIPAGLRRRTVLAHALAGAGLLATGAFAVRADTSTVPVANVTGLYTVRVSRVAAPTTREEVAEAVRAWPGRIAVGGGRFSMGGQTAIAGGLHLDLRGMNRLVWLDADRRTVRVQAGMRWRDLQDHLDPLDLSVRTMQSYANFTVGGSISVNAHGRYVDHGPIAHSVRALQLVMADGRIVEVSRSRMPQLFRAALGGYGAVGVVTEVELDLDRNARLLRTTEEVSLDAYPAYFQQHVRGRGVLLHNADLLPPAFDRAHAVNWTPTELPLTEPRRLTPRDADYKLDRKVIKAVSEWPNGDQLQRQVIRPALMRKPVVAWRNHEASLDTAWSWPGATTRPVSTPRRSSPPAAAPRPMCCRSTSCRSPPSTPSRGSWPT